MRASKHLLVLCGLVLLLGCDKIKSTTDTAAGSIFGTDFEGEITMNALQKGQAAKTGPTTLVFGIKKPKYRIDATGGISSDNPMLSQGAAFLLDPPQKKGWLLSPAQKTAVVLDFEKMKSGGIPGKPKPSANQPPPKVEKTGKKDVVAGYTCEVWKITQNDGRKAEVCAAEGITWIDLGDMGWSTPDITLAAVASEANRFPLRIVSFDAKGAEETRLEATKVEKKKLDDARFVVPPDYRVMDMSGLFGNIPGAPNGTPKGLPDFRPK
jgi:hypothetical protein